MNTVRNILSAAVAAMVAAAAGTAGADPTPAPSPFQIIGPNGPVVQGVPTYPPICLVAPLACALRYTPCGRQGEDVRTASRRRPGGWRGRHQFPKLNTGVTVLGSARTEGE